MNTKNTVLATILVFFITLEVLITLDFIAQEKHLSEKRSVIYSLIFKLHNEIGYVGLIHNFKNSIIRPEESRYRKQALENYTGAVSTINQLEREVFGFGGIAPIKLHKTREMLKAYKSQLDRIPGLIKSRMTLQQIDAEVRVNDEPSNIELRQFSTKIIATFDERFTRTLERSVTAGFITLVAIIVSLVLTIRFFFKDQARVIAHNNTLKHKMDKHRKELLNSQSTLLSVFNDVKQEKLRTSELNVQLAKKNEEMQAFVYTVSHDLKSPLVTIGGFSKKLSQELSGNITEKQAYRLQRISENVDQMEALMSDLLELSRVTQQTIDKKRVDTELVVTEQCKTLENLIHETGTVINIHQPLHAIYANERSISECILNLISNAIQYRDLKRSLVIEISTTQDTAKTVLTVKDNGIGIDVKYHQRIFNVFEHLSESQGTGIGLSIVKKMMENHQGDVALDSVLGEGSSFYLIFPNEHTEEHPHD